MSFAKHSKWVLYQLFTEPNMNTAFSGKSTLLSNLAGVYSEVAAYEFTTLTTVPGCIKYKVRRTSKHQRDLPTC